MKALFVTGGAGFIGSALVRLLVGETAYHVVNVDALTYAGNLDSVAPVSGDARYHFERADICVSDGATTSRVHSRLDCPCVPLSRSSDLPTVAFASSG